MSQVEGRTETPEAKRAVIERLYALWCTYPELRLGQLLMNCFRPEQVSHYYLEDMPLIETLEQFYEWHTRRRILAEISRISQEAGEYD